MRILEIQILPEDAGRTIRSILADRLYCSGSLIKSLKKRGGAVCLNGVPAERLNMRVSAGDVLCADVDDEGEIPTNGVCPIPIVYEDEDLLILNKPAGMPVHPAGMTAMAGTVAEAVSGYLGGRALHCVNRLDRGTTGLMAVAKSAYAHERLRDEQRVHSIEREYRAIVHGVVSPPCGVIDLPIARERESAIRRVVSPDGSAARTGYETLCAGGEYTVLRVLPETGRTHQIRVHMASIGHPLFGDWLYGKEEPEWIARPALHSMRIRMRNPVTGAHIDLTAPLPDDMKALLIALGCRD